MVCLNKAALQKFNSLPDSELIFSMPDIEGLVTQSIDIIPKIAIPDIRLKFWYDDADLAKIDQFLNTMHQYLFQTMDPEEVQNLLEESFMIEKTWICHACCFQNITILDRKKHPGVTKEMAKDKMVELSCMRWKSFKPIELYPSFYHNKTNISKEELNILSKRRTTERKLITKNDSAYNQNNNDWFIINSEWLSDWKMFVNNKRWDNAYGARRSKNTNVGILDPGPITNNILLDKDNNPLEGLSRGKQYRGVNKYVWQQLYNTYGGGPVLRRNEINIYSKEFNEPEWDESEFAIIDSKAIKNYFNKDKQNEIDDGDSQPVVGNELNGVDKQHIKQMMTFKSCKLASKRSSENKLDNLLLISNLKIKYFEM